MTDEPPPQTGSAKTGLIGCLIIVALVLGGCGVLAMLGSGDSGPTDVDAKIMCERFVKDKLKSPGSAEFSEENAVEAGGAWTVSGAVDSQNSFGALVRNQFTCKVKPRTDGKTWDLVALTGLSK
jgi:hypothetical protein